MGLIIVELVNLLVTLLRWAIIGAAILSWLFAFDVINYRNRFVAQIGRFLEAVTEPFLGPFRRVIPPMGGMDISPLVALLVLWLVQRMFNTFAAPMLIEVLG